MEEIWVDIKGFEEKYQISNFGKVYSKVTGRLRKIQKNRYGYLYVTLSITTKKQKIETIHQLVARHYIDSPNNKTQVNHIDGNKENNIYTNLEWVTPKENISHAHKIGLRNNEGLLKSVKSREKKVYQIDANTGDVIKIWDSLRKITRETDFSFTPIQRCCVLEEDIYKGFRWRYEETKDQIVNKKKRNDTFENCY